MKRFANLVPLFIAAMLLASIGTAPRAKAQELTPERVTPANLGQDWAALNLGAGALDFVEGPAGQPYGTGSLQMVLTANADKANIYNYSFVGVRLAEVSSLGFSTYIPAGRVSPSLQLEIDPDGTGPGVPTTTGSLTNYATLAFEPYYRNGVTAGTWQTWNVMTANAGLWATRIAGGPSGLGTQSNPATWAQFLALYPNATVSGGFGPNAGRNWGAYTAHVDGLTIGTAAATVVFDFEPIQYCTSLCYVDAAMGSDTVRGGTSADDAFKTIGKAIATVQAGGEVQVLAGNYVERVVVDKDLTLAGEAGAVVQAPANLPAGGSLVQISGSGTVVEVSGLTVSGPGPSGCGSIGYGILVSDGATASIHGNSVVDIRDQEAACDSGIGLGVTGGASATVVGNTFSGYQKGGVVVTGAGTQSTLEGNTVLGAGPVDTVAQNGIQVSDGASASINHNTISGHAFTPAGAVATGILLLGPGQSQTSGNTVTENEVGIYVADASGTHADNTVSATASGTGTAAFWGVIVGAGPAEAQPAPFAAGAAARLAAAAATIQTVNLSGNTVTSDGSAGGLGMAAYGGYGTANLDLTVTGNDIHYWDYGMVVADCTTDCGAGSLSQVMVSRNSFEGNVTYALDATGTDVTVDASANWWGAADGPTGSNGVAGNANYSLWLIAEDLSGDPVGGVYFFTGFFSPIDMNNVINITKAGQSVPAKWRLIQNGHVVSDAHSFSQLASRRINCASLTDATGTDAIESYAGGSGLQYLGDGYWQYNWKTPKTYAKQCYRMWVELEDGSTSPVAYFQFK